MTRAEPSQQAHWFLWENERACGVFFCEIKSKGFTFQHTRDLPKRAEGVVCPPSRTSEAGYRGGGGPELPDGLDHAEAHFHTAVGVVLAGLRKPGDAVVAVPQDFDAKTVMLLEGTGGGEDRVSQHTGQCRRRAWRRGARAQEVCTLGSGAPTLDKSLSYLPRKLGGTPNRAWGGSQVECGHGKATGFWVPRVQGPVPALPRASVWSGRPLCGQGWRRVDIHPACPAPPWESGRPQRLPSQDTCPNEQF